MTSVSQKSVEEEIAYDAMVDSVKEVFSEKLKAMGFEPMKDGQEFGQLTVSHQNAIKLCKDAVRAELANIMFKSIRTN